MWDDTPKKKLNIFVGDPNETQSMRFKVASRKRAYLLV